MSYPGRPSLVKAPGAWYNPVCLKGQIPRWIDSRRVFSYVPCEVMLRDYEVVMILSPQIADEEVAATLERVKQFVQDQGGQVKEINPWGRRKLAYPIERHLEGTYVVAQITMDSASVRALEERLRMADGVIRHLVVRVGET